MGKSKNTITVKVGRKNIDKGICSNENKCAVAQAFVDKGFDTASVDGENAILTKKVKFGKATLVAKFLAYLPFKVQDFIERFDEATSNTEKAALKAFNFNVKIVPYTEDSYYMGTQ